MKLLTEHRGAASACAFTLLSACALMLSGTAAAAPRRGTGSSSSFEKTPFHLTKSSSADTSAGGSVVRTIIAFLIVVAVIYGLYWLLKRRRRGKNSPSGDGLQQIASLPLGASRAVMLVRVGSELHLLGVTEHSVNGIRVFSEEEAYELGLPMDDGAQYLVDEELPPIPRLLERLRRLTTR